jgi:hypothetical protein
MPEPLSFAATAYHLRGYYHNNIQEHIRILRDDRTAITELTIDISYVQSMMAHSREIHDVVLEFVRYNKSLREIRIFLSFYDDADTLLFVDVVHAVGNNASIHIIFTDWHDGVLSRRNLGRMAAGLRSLHHIESLELRFLSQNFLDTILTSLTYPAGHQLKKLRVKDIRPKDPTEVDEVLRPVKDYLISAAISIQSLDLQVKKFCRSSMNLLVEGLEQNNSVNRLGISCDMDVDAASIFAGFLSRDSNIQELVLDAKSMINGPMIDGPEFLHGQSSLEQIIPALYTNTSLVTLESEFAFNSPTSGQLLGELLRQSPSLRALKLHVSTQELEIATQQPDLLRPFLQSIVHGLHDNTSLKRFEFFSGDYDSDNIRQLTDFLTDNRSRPRHLEHLVLDGFDDVTDIIADTLRHPSFSLKRLDFQGTVWLDELDELLLAVQGAATLETLVLGNVLLYIDDTPELVNEHLSALGLRIPQMKGLRHLTISVTDDYSYFQVPAMVEHAKTAILAGVEASEHLEYARITVVNSIIESDIQFQKKLQSCCVRNLANKAKAAMKEGTLPLAALPHVMKALQKHSNDEDHAAAVQKTFCTSVLFSFLSTHPASAPLESIAQQFIASSSSVDPSAKKARYNN